VSAVTIPPFALFGSGATVNTVGSEETNDKPERVAVDGPP
jgi:hypothetical protein